MDVMEMYALIQKAYVVGAKSAPAAWVAKGDLKESKFPRRCAFCKGSDFVTRIEVNKDPESDFTTQELVCKDCWMPVEVE